MASIWRTCWFLGGLLLVPSEAGAQATAPRVLIVESHGGPRAEEAGRLLEEVRGELAKRFPEAVTPEDVESRVSGPGDVMDAERRASLARQVDDGYDAWIRGRFDEAVAKLATALNDLQGAPATMAVHQELRDKQLRALVGLALAHNRLGNRDAAVQAMAELIRSFPDKEISRSMYGPEPWEIHRGVLSPLRAEGTGELILQADDPAVVFFVNERYVGVGKTALNELFPGRYRVFTRRGTHAGRVHQIDVRAGQRARLDVRWALDSALRSREFIGLEFVDERTRDEWESEAVALLAERVQATTPIVLGIRDYGGRQALVGAVLSPTSSEPVRMAAVLVEPVRPDSATLRSLASYLAGGEAGEGVLVGPPPEPPRSPERPVSGGAGSGRAWGWGFLGTGVAATAAGVALVFLHQPEIVNNDRQELARNTRTAGIVTASAGAVLAGIGLYLLLRTDGSEPGAAVSVTPTSSGWSLTWIGRF